VCPPGDAAAHALAALDAALRQRFVNAQLVHRQSPDGLRRYIDVVTDCEDDFEVLETVAAATIDIFLAHGIQLHVFPFRRAAT
jgi:molybdopterin/thiamine biosynthesis adenylyltransferase